METAKFWNELGNALFGLMAELEARHSYKLASRAKRRGDDVAKVILDRYTRGFISLEDALKLKRYFAA